MSARLVLPLVLLAAATAFAPTAGAQADLRARVDALVETGKLADAESAARSAGAGGAVALAEVLVLRGQLATADSVAQAASRSARSRYARPAASLSRAGQVAPASS